MTDTTDIRALVERLRLAANTPKRTGITWVSAQDLTAALDRIEALEAQQENAAQAMAETHNSWEARCYAIMAMLEQDFGGFSTDAPDVGSWYEMNSRRMQKRIADLEGILDNRQHGIYDKVRAGSIADHPNVKALITAAHNDAIEAAADYLEPKNDRYDWTQYAYDCHRHATAIRHLKKGDTP